jgi:tetratricopeptide (TPR) repeat protein
MKELLTADRMHVRAADAWISAGDLNRAQAELSELSTQGGEHPETLQVRWHLAEAARQWERCAEIARALTQVASERSFGWVHLALSLRRLHQYREAISTLHETIAQFGDSPALQLNLAGCYAALKQLPDAERCLERAFQLTPGSPARQRLSLRVYEEPDLEPVWNSSSQVQENLFADTRQTRGKES